MDNKSEHTRRKIISSLVGAGVVSVSGCTSSNQQETEAKETPEENLNEFPKLREWSGLDPQFKEEIILIFERTPYEHKITLEAYPYVPKSPPTQEETTTVATIDANYKNRVLDKNEGWKRIELSWDPSKLQNSLYHRFLIRATNTNTGNSRILADKRARNVYKHPFEEEYYELHNGAPSEFRKGDTTYRPVKYDFLVDSTEYYSRNDQVKVRGIASDLTEVRINGFTNSVTDEEAQFAKELREKFYEQDFNLFESLEYEMTVNASRWDFIDQNSGEYMYNIDKNPQITNITNHVKKARELCNGAFNQFSEVGIAHSIFYNNFTWHSQPFDGKVNAWARTLQPAELWKKGRGNCADLSVSLATVLHKFGYEVALADVYPGHTCATVKLPKQIVDKHMVLSDGGTNESYLRQDDDYVWIFVDPLERNIGVTQKAQEYSVVEDTIREGTREELY